MAAEKKRTAGGVALKRTGKTSLQIAKEVGVSKVSVHEWIHGSKSPGQRFQAKMFELYGLEPAWWKLDAPKSDPPPSSPTRSSTPNTEAVGGAFQMARQLQIQVQAGLESLEDPKQVWAPAEKAQVMQRLANTVNVLAKLTGQYELGKRMLQLPIWKQLESEMFEALKSFPEASKACALRLRKFEKEWLGRGE